MAHIHRSYGKRDHLTNKQKKKKINAHSSSLQLAEGFVIMLSIDGTIIFVSENVVNFNGFNQVSEFNLSFNILMLRTKWNWRRKRMGEAFFSTHTVSTISQRIWLFSSKIFSSLISLGPIFKITLDLVGSKNEMTWYFSVDNIKFRHFRFKAATFM